MTSKPPQGHPSGRPAARPRPLAGLVALAVLAAGCSDAGTVGSEPDTSGVTLPHDPAALDAELAALIDQHVTRVRDKPEAGRRHGTLGLVYEANNLWPEALESFGRARELAPDDPTWALHTAIAEQKLGDLDAALESVRAGVAVHPDFAPLWGRVGDLSIERGDLQEAREAYATARRLAPEAAEPLVGLAEIALQDGATEEAIGLLESALEIDDLYRSAHYLLGLAYRSAGRLEEAERELKLGARGKKRGMTDPGSARLSRLAAGAGQMVVQSRRLLSQRRFADAAQLLEPLVTRYPENARLRLNLGIAWFELGRTEEGLRALEQAARLDPELHMIPYNLASFHLTLGQNEEALRQADHALELDGEFAPSHFLRGRALLALERLDEAGRALSEALRRAPQDANVQQAIGELAHAQGHPEEAREILASARALAPQDPRPAIALARLELAEGDLAAAEEAIEAARALAPGDATVEEVAARIQAARDE